MKNALLILTLVIVAIFSWILGNKCGQTPKLSHADSSSICKAYIHNIKASRRSGRPHPLETLKPGVPPGPNVPQPGGSIQAINIKKFPAARRILANPYSDTIPALTAGQMLQKYIDDPVEDADADYFLFDAYTLYNFIYSTSSVQDIMLQLARDPSTKVLTIVISGIDNSGKQITIGSAGSYLEHCYPCPECDFSK